MLDLDKAKDNTIDNSNKLNAFQTIEEYANQIIPTSKSQGFVKEYRKLYSSLASSGSYKEFVESTKDISNLSALMQQDAELDKIIDSIKNNDGVFSMVDLGDYLLQKSLGGQGLSEYLSNASDKIKQIVDQQDIAKLAPQDLSPEMIQTIADTLHESYSFVQQNLDSVF